MAKKKEKEVTPVEETPVVETPVPEAPVTKKPSLGLLIIPAIVVLVLLVGIIARVATSSPKAVFKTSINNSYKDVSKYLKKLDKFMEVFDAQEKAISFKGDLKFSTDREDYTESEIKDLNISFEAGLDLKHEEFINGITLEGDKESFGETIYYTEGQSFVKASFLEDVYQFTDDDSGLLFNLLGLEDQGIGELFEIYKEKEEDIDIDPETYDYLLKTVKNAVNKSLDSKSMKKEKGSFEVDGKNVKATKVSYIFTKSSTKDLVNKVVDRLLNDDKFIDKLADSTGLEKADIKDYLKEMKDSAKEIDFDEDIIVNIYIKGLFNKVVGFSLEYDEKEYFTVFTDGKTTEAIYDNHAKDDYRTKLVVTAVKNKKETEVTVKYNKDKIATATIRKFEEKVVDFDVIIYSDEEKSTISVYLTGEQKKNVVSGEYKLKAKAQGEYEEISGSYTLEASDELSGFKVDDAKKYDEEEHDEAIITAAKEVVEKDDKLNALLGDSIEAYEVSIQPSYNSDGMIPVYWDDDFYDIFKSNKARVLYVGSSYYSSYYEATEYELFNSLKTAQTKYKFHSYYLPYYYMEDEYLEKLGDTNTCEYTYDCDMYPAIYFIKDGKVKKILRGTVKLEDIEAALQEIGIS